MCQHCGTPSAVHELPRRNFLKLATTAVAGAFLASRAQAASDGPPPKPQNVISPDAAFERLMKGNRRYVKGVMMRHDFQNDRAALALGQNPFAGVLSCADSRVAPELAFDTGRGDIFVCRGAGNFADRNTIASFEYSVAVLGVPAILVLGHGSCGAVSSTIKAVKDGATFPGHIPSLVKAITPAVKMAEKQPGDLLANSIRDNVILTVDVLKKSSPILDQAIAAGKLKIYGGVYELGSGRVDLVA